MLSCEKQRYEAKAEKHDEHQYAVAAVAGCAGDDGVERRTDDAGELSEDIKEAEELVASLLGNDFAEVGTGYSLNAALNGADQADLIDRFINGLGDEV